MPVRTVIAQCPRCGEATMQKEVYEELDDGSDEVAVTICTVCNQDV